MDVVSPGHAKSKRRRRLASRRAAVRVCDANRRRLSVRVVSRSLVSAAWLALDGAIADDAGQAVGTGVPMKRDQTREVSDTVAGLALAIAIAGLLWCVADAVLGWAMGWL